MLLFWGVSCDPCHVLLSQAAGEVILTFLSVWFIAQQWKDQHIRGLA